MPHRVEPPEAPGRRSSSGWRQVAGADTLSQRVAFLLRDVAGGDRRVDARDPPSLIASPTPSWLMPRAFATSLNKSEAGLFDAVDASAAPPPSMTASAAAAVASHLVRFTSRMSLRSACLLSRLAAEL